MNVLSPLDLPHRTVRGLLREGAPVYLPVNPVEYHGPHLSLHNDRLVADGLMRALHARLAPEMPLLAVPDLEVGVDPVRGPGSRAVAYHVVRGLVRSACRSLLDLGASRVVLMTFHGAPLHNAALQDGVELLVSRGVRALNPLAELLRLTVQFGPELRAQLEAVCETIADPAARGRMIAGLQQDFHAGFLETSLALHLAPESVAADLEQLPACPPGESWAPLLAAAGLAARLGRAELAAELRFAAWGLGWYGLRPHPGYTGEPALANAAAGRLLTDMIADRAAHLCREVFAGAPPPRPPLTWMRGLTLRGRLPGPDIGQAPWAT